MTESVDDGRRVVLKSAIMTIAAAGLGAMESGSAQAAEARAADDKKTGSRTSASFSSQKQIQAGLLNVGYAGQSGSRRYRYS